MKKYARVSDGVVVEFLPAIYSKTDGNEIQPELIYSADVVGQLVDVQSHSDVVVGSLYANGEFSDPVLYEPSNDDLIREFAIIKAGKLTIAGREIAPLQDAVDLDIATTEEIAALADWKAYRVAVNRADQQESYPRVVWPLSPGEINE